MSALCVFLFYPIYAFNPIQGNSTISKATLFFYPFPWAPFYILKLCLKTHIRPAPPKKTAHFYDLSIIHRVLALVSYFSEQTMDHWVVYETAGYMFGGTRISSQK